MPVRFVSIKGGARSTVSPPPPPPPPTTTLMLDSRSSSPVSTGPLAAGPYTVTVTGTVSVWNGPLTKGSAEPDAIYPTPSTGRRSTQVGLDAETRFAEPSIRSYPLTHIAEFEIDIGANWQHIEPVGGPYTTPRAGHAYTYHLTSTGQPFAFRWLDAGSYADNYGQFRITITKG